MQILRSSRRGFARALSAALVLGAFALGASAQITTYYVATDGDDGDSGTSVSEPFETIGKAVAVASGNAPARILVAAGLYDQQHEMGSPFSGFPILIDFSDVSIEARTTTFPQIGGGVADSSAKGLFEVKATVGTDPDATGVEFVNLHFVGEDSANENAPSAIYAESADEALVEVTVSGCIIDRSEMNHATLDGHPSILGIAGPGDGLTLSVLDCTIEPNEDGGVVVDVGTDATTETALPVVTIADCEFTLSSGQASTAAVDMLIEGYDPSGPNGLSCSGTLSVTDCVIDSSAATTAGTGFTWGIAYGGDARHGGSVSFGHTSVFIQRNEIVGCEDAGLYLLGTSDGLMDSGVNIQSWFVDINLIVENRGDGIVVEGGDPDNSGQYLRWYFRGNMITDNGGDGLELRGISSSNTGQCHLLNCTVAGNGGYGIRMVDSDEDAWLSHIQNTIVWGNSSGSSSGWLPGAMAVTLQYSIWDGTPPVTCSNCGCSPRNDGDDDFVDAGAGDYHLLSGSCAVDAGTNNPSTTNTMGYGTDIDGDRRAIDGDGNSSTIVDIGADEYDP